MQLLKTILCIIVYQAMYIRSCNYFHIYSTCVGSRDPYCVWDTSLSQCVVSSIVPTNYNGSASVPNG